MGTLSKMAAVAVEEILSPDGQGVRYKQWMQFRGLGFVSGIQIVHHKLHTGTGATSRAVDKAMIMIVVTCERL